MATALEGCGPAVASAVLAAVDGQFEKAQRQVEAVKAAALLLASAKAGKLAAPTAAGGRSGTSWQEVQAAIERAMDTAAAGNPKLLVSLQRLSGVLEEVVVAVAAAVAQPGAAAAKRLGKKEEEGRKKKPKL